MARGCWSGALRGGPSLGASGMRGAACSARSRAVLALHHADGCQRGPWDRDISRTPGTARGRDVPAAKAQQEPALRSPYGCRRPPSSLAPPPRHRKGLPKEPSTQRGQGARDGRGSTGCSCAEGPRQLRRGAAAAAGAGPRERSRGCGSCSCPVGRGGIELAASPRDQPLGCPRGASARSGRAPRHPAPLRALRVLWASGTQLSRKCRSTCPGLQQTEKQEIGSG